MWSRLLAGALVATAALAAGCGTDAPPPPPPTVAAPAPSTPPPARHQARHGVRGTVTAQDGATWTVTTAAERRFTVTVTPQTRFGTHKAAATAQQFPVGTHVKVTGAVNGTTVTAERIRAGGTEQRPPVTTAPPTTPAVATA